MKIELKTGDNYSSRPLLTFIFTSVVIFLIIVISNISLKLSNISRFYEINYACRLLKIDKSSSKFKKISRFTNLKNKQKIWEFCREIANH